MTIEIRSRIGTPFPSPSASVPTRTQGWLVAATLIGCLASRQAAALPSDVADPSTPVATRASGPATPPTAPDDASTAQAALVITVADDSRAPIAGAIVSLRPMPAGVERLGTSDDRGHVRFAGVPHGRYRLDVSGRGFAISTQTLTIDSGERNVPITLAPAPIVEQVTVVSGSRIEQLRETVDAPVEILTRDRLHDSLAETVGEALREVPGVVTRRGTESAGAAGEQIQGLDSRQVLVLLDGQPLLGARGIKRGVLNLDRQSTNRLDRVEVVKGAASALYGSDAIGGVINLFTRQAERPIEAAFSVTGGSLDAADVTGDAGFKQGPWSGFFTVEQHRRDSFDLSPVTPDTTGADFRRNDALAKVQWQASPAFRVSALANGYWNRSRGRSVGEEGLQSDDIKDDAQSYGLRVDWQAAPQLSVEGRGYVSRYDEASTANLLTGAPLAPGALYERLGKADATATLVLGARHVAQGGVEWSRDTYRGINRLRDDGGHAAETAVVWAQDRFAVTGRTTLTVGARFDHHSIFGSAFSPKAGVNVRLTDDWRARVSYGRGFRAPDLGQLYYRFLNPTNFYQVIGNPLLEPERSHSWQAGSDVRLFDRRVRLGVNIFRNDVDNLIDSVSLGFMSSQSQLADIMAREQIDPAFRPQLFRLLFLYKNLQDVVTSGAELDGEWSLTRSVSLGAAYTYLGQAYGRQITATGPGPRQDLTGRHPHQGHVRVRWETARLGGLRANLRGVFFSEWIATRGTVNGQPVDTMAPKFALWDVAVSKPIRAGLEFVAAIDNLTDSRDPNSDLSVDGRPAAVYRPEYGRTYRAGVRWSFAR